MRIAKLKRACPALEHCPATQAEPAPAGRHNSELCAHGCGAVGKYPWTLQLGGGWGCEVCGPKSGTPSYSQDLWRDKHMLACGIDLWGEQN